MKKNKKMYISIIIILVIYSIIMIILFYNTVNTKNSDYNFRNMNKYTTFLNTVEKEELKSSIKNYLKQKLFDDVYNITFITSNENSGVEYFYFYLDDEVETLIEGSYKDGDFDFIFIGNKLNPTIKSEVTGYTYRRIMNET